ncbi:hypothetical protein QNH10_13265 [Sporosarcina thermotolerans]|uniref:hypothetical protein n=1 Tax=Sporosarcina thermotolerans TaxID=633404 RepID=UPI0024BCFDA8|nr:hypothetical protein [Sporosarcina thermotolerans]WHT47204.1 hypothetical protein QNH10_13265 [Sporosarcina thermotolerans]
MKGIRGRFGQMKMLKAELDATVNLAEITRFSKDNFFKALTRNQVITIMPVMGPQEIKVDPVNQIVELADTHIQYSTKEEIYEYLAEHVLIKKHYVLQTIPVPKHSVLHVHRFTLHRISPSSNWKVVHHTMSGDYGFGKTLKSIPIWKAFKLVVHAANVLGNFYSSCNTTVIEVMQNKMENFGLPIRFYMKKIVNGANTILYIAVEYYAVTFPEQNFVRRKL